jgi:5'-nucleotidase
VREEKIPGVKTAWSVEGKPADCVKMALLSLLSEQMDLVISGINEGANAGSDTLYSGTVAAAMEGALNGLPALALSLVEDRKPWNFETAAQVGLTLYRRWEAGVLPLAPLSILNVNVPNLPLEQLRGYKPARLGIQRYDDSYDLLEEAEDYRNFRLLGSRLPGQEADLALDTVALCHGYVTLTPISVDRTDYALLKEIEKYFG